MKESNSGRLNPIRRWDMTPATGKISEGQIDLDEDECPPAISIAGTDEDIMQASSFIMRNNHACLHLYWLLKMTFRFSNNDWQYETPKSSAAAR